MLVLLLMFHDGEKITLEYGDTIYVNVAPGPFMGGRFVTTASKQSYGIVNFVPNINLSYQDKVEYFIKNYKEIDGASVYATTLISQIMPAIKEKIKLKGLITQDSNVADKFKEKIKDFVGIYPKCTYGSTETLMCSAPSVANPLGFIFDWRRGVFEFHLVKKGEINKDELLRMDEVKVGEIYQPVFTSFDTEITRYVIGDALKCVSVGDDILGTDFPVFKYYSRIEKTISVQNFTRLSEDEIVSALEDSGVPWVEFTVRTEVVGGIERAVIYLELSEDMDATEVEKRIHECLYSVDVDYRELSDFFDYIPIKVRIVPKGTFNKFLGLKATGLPKVDRINMREEDFLKFLSLLKN